MKRVLIGSVALLVFLIAMPAMAKGVIGVTIEGPGIAEPVFLEGEGTSESADQFYELVKATGFTEMAWGAAVTGKNQIFTEQPTDELGPEFLLTWIQIGPEGDVEIPTLLYPFASGGPLIYMDPGVELVEISSTARGGWFVSSYNIEAMLLDYGVDVSAVKSTIAPVEVETVKPAPLAAPELAAVETSQTPAAVPILLGAALFGTVGLAGFWATGRRPRRPETS